MDSFGFRKKQLNNFALEREMSEEDPHRALLARLNRVSSNWEFEATLREVQLSLDEEDFSGEEKSELIAKVNQIQLELLTQSSAATAGENEYGHMGVYYMQLVYRLLEANPYMEEADKEQYDELLKETIEPKVVEVFSNQIADCSDCYSLKKMVEEINSFPFKTEASRDAVLQASDEQAVKMLEGAIVTSTDYGFNPPYYADYIKDFPFKDETLRQELKAKYDDAEFNKFKFKITEARTVSDLAGYVKGGIERFEFAEKEKSGELLEMIDERAKGIFSSEISYNGTGLYQLINYLKKAVEKFPFADVSVREELQRAIDEKATEIIMSDISQQTNIFSLQGYTLPSAEGFPFVDEGKRLGLISAVDDRANFILSDLIENTSQTYMLRDYVKHSIENFPFSDETIRQELLERVLRKLS